MADNVTANPGTGGAVFAADDISSVYYPRNKVCWGADGTANDTDAASGKALPVQGDAAHDAVDYGNPAKIGAVARSSEPTAVASADRVALIADLVGKLITLPYANPENFVNGTTSAITDTTSTQAIAAQGAGVRTYITSITITNSHATVGTFVKVLDGSTIAWEGYCAAAGGGFCISLPVPLRGTANTAVNIQPVTTGANVIASVAGYKGV